MSEKNLCGGQLEETECNKVQEENQETSTKTTEAGTSKVRGYRSIPKSTSKRSQKSGKNSIPLSPSISTKVVTRTTKNV